MSRRLCDRTRLSSISPFVLLSSFAPGLHGTNLSRRKSRRILWLGTIYTPLAHIRPVIPTWPKDLDFPHSWPRSGLGRCWMDLGLYV